MVYVAAENPPWKVERNQELQKVRGTLRRALPAAAYEKLDFRYNECSVVSEARPDANHIGRMTRRGWTWFDSELVAVHPSVSLEKLKHDGVFSDPDE